MRTLNFKCFKLINLGTIIIDQAEKLIANLKSLNNENTRIRQYQIMNRIKQMWKDVGKECKFYSKEMKNALNKSEFIRKLKIVRIN